MAACYWPGDWPSQHRPRGGPTTPLHTGNPQKTGRSSLGATGGGGTSTAQLVLLALAAATAIFFTTSMLVMDAPIIGKGFGPSQFVARVGRTAALAGVGQEQAPANRSSEAEEGAAAAAGGKKGGADVVKKCT